MPDPAIPDRARPDPAPPGLNPLAGLAAAALPGAGYLVLGQPRRALAAAAGVLGLFFGGMFIGGIDVVDSREDAVWFYGEALVGPIAFGVDYLHQNHFKAMGPDRRVPGAPLVLRDGYPGEVRSADDQGRAVWRPATEAELAAGAGPPNIKSVGRMNEIGTLYATLAGMLNLILVLDALVPSRRRGEGEGATPEGAAAGVAAAVIVGGAAS